MNLKLKKSVKTTIVLINLPAWIVYESIENKIFPWSLLK